MGITTKWSLPYPDGEDVPDVPEHIENLATDLDGVAMDSQGLLSARPLATQSGRYYYATDNDLVYRANGSSWKIVSPPTYVTALPSSPADGTEVYYSANPGYSGYTAIWHLRYRSAAAGSYKWEYVGGSPIMANVATAETTTSTSPVDLATVGPRIDYPLSGDYEITYSAGGYHTSAAGLYVALSVGGSMVYNGLQFLTPGATGVPEMGEHTYRLLAQTAGNNLRLQYYSTGGAGQAVFTQRALRVTPVRVG